MAQGQSYPINFLRQDNFYTDPITNNLSTNNPAYPYSSIFTALFIALGFSVRQKAATDYYVDPSGGNDANSGAIGSPWRTFAHAMAVLILLDFAGQTVTLHLVNNATEGFVAQVWTGGGKFVLDLGGKTLNATSANAVFNAVDLPGNITIQNGTLATSGAGFFNCVQNVGVGTIVIGAGVHFGAALLFHMTCTGGGAYIKFSANYNIDAAALGHMAVFSGGSIVHTNDPSSTTGFIVTTNGALNFGLYFAHVEQGAAMLMLGMTYRDTGGGASLVTTPNNKRADLATFGTMSGTGGNAGFFPGTGGITNGNPGGAGYV